MKKHKVWQLMSLLLTLLMIFNSTQTITQASQLQSVVSLPSTYTPYISAGCQEPLFASQLQYNNDFENAYNILTATLNGSVGVQGFDGNYAISCPNEIVEIVVQFITPSSVALRLMQESAITPQRSGRALQGGSFEEQALSAHSAFNQQLGSIAMPFSSGVSTSMTEIYSEHHRLFNGVFMRVPGYMVWVIAALPEVFAVTPNMTFYTIYDLEQEQPEDCLQNEYDELEWSCYAECERYPCDKCDELEQYPYYPQEEPTKCLYCPEDVAISCDKCGEAEQCPYYPEEEYEQNPYDYYYDTSLLAASPLNATSIVYENFMRTVREYFNLDYIHNTVGLTGAGVRVAVLDTGIYHAHPEFANFLDETGRIRGRGHHIEGNAPSSNSSHRARNHGTTVSGAVIAVAPGVELWHYRVELNNGGGGMHPIAAIEAAHEDGIDVVNMSFGGGNSPFNPINRVVNTAALDGMVMVAAAGNRGGMYFAVSTPANASLGIAVAAGTTGSVFDHGDTLRPYSSHGPVFLVNHIKPDIVAPTAVVTTDLFGRYSSSSGGTSHAAPIIAGIAALLIEAFPNDTPYEIKARMMNTARPLADIQLNSVFAVGAGFVQPLYALTNQAVVTIEHYVPVMGSPVLPFELATMASLSFGTINLNQVGNMGRTIPVSIRNTGDSTATYTISYMFTRNNGGAASINLSTTSVTVAPGGTSQFDVTMLIADSAYTGFYEGYIYVNNGSTIVARLPFGAVLEGELSLSFVRVYTEEQLRQALLQARPIYSLTVIEVAADITITRHMPVAFDTNIFIRSADEYIRTLEGANDLFTPLFMLRGNLTLENIRLVRMRPVPERSTFDIGVLVDNFGHLTMLDGAVISGHEVAGVVVETGGFFTMTGGEISGNGSLGCGVMIREWGTANMYGGIISGNAGAGVTIAIGGVFNMHDGEISDNFTSQYLPFSPISNGGVVVLGRHSSDYCVATFNMHGGKISGNTGFNGGGITLVNHSSFNMYGGEILDNTAENDGGGIFFSGPLATVNIYDGNISGNIANDGGGIGTDTINNIHAGSLRIGSDAVFSNNRASRAFNRLPADDDVYYEFINTTHWSRPFAQGFNNFDIQYTNGAEIAVRTLYFQLNGTLANPTDPLQIESANTFYSTPIMSAVGFPGNPTRLGYIFAGWYLGNGFTIRVTPETLMPDVDTTIYARWHAIEQIRVLNFQLNGTAANQTNPLQIDPLYVPLNTPITQAFGFPGNPTRLGYIFTGWYLDIGLTQKVTSDTLMLANTTIYANWEARLPRIRFYFNIPDFYEYIEVELENINQPIPLHLRPSIPTRYGTPGNPGWAFLGWYEELFLGMHYTGNPSRITHAERLAAIDLLSNLIITEEMLDANGVFELHATWGRFGNASGSGAISGVDRALLQSFILNSITVDDIIFQTADVNMDGIIDGMDRSLLQNHMMSSSGVILGPSPGQ